MGHYRHVIWDWNGTLLDDAWLCVEVLNGLLARRRYAPISLSQYGEDFDFPVIDYYRRLGFDFERESYDAVAHEFLAEYDRRRCECRLREGAPEAIAALSSRGLSQHVLSAYEQRRLEASVAHLDLRGCFDRIVGLADHSASSKVENGRSLMLDLGVGPGEVLFIGDTLHDHEVACAIGADCALIPSGHHALPRLSRCGARVLASLRDVMTLDPEKR